MNLSGLDLNLLVALDALLSERSVSAAARRVGLSQPAMSNALSRLRRQFGDPLLVRRGRRMIPTTRAEALRLPVHTALAAVQRVLTPPSFDPKTAQRTFRLACSDYLQTAILPDLMRSLRVAAPEVVLEVIAPEPGSFAVLLGSGNADLVMGVSQESSPRIRQQILFSDRFQCILNTKHPRIKTRMTRRQMREERFVGVSPPGTLPWSIRGSLEDQGIPWRPALIVPSRAAAAFVVAKTSLIALLSQRLGRSLAKALPLRALRPPVQLPEFEVRQFWDETADDDPGHRWFRELVARAAQDPG